MAEESCPFCEIVAGRAPATIVREWPETLAIVPLGPVVDGHLIVIPKAHVTDFVADPGTSATTMLRAADLAGGYPAGSMNLITSRGAAATQSVFHLHLHLVPRTEGDGLALPWHSGKRSRTQITVHPDPPHVAEAIRDVRRYGGPPRQR